MTPDELEELREGWDFEAKKAGGKDGQGALPLSVWETYSAMANTQGGVILLGAKEHADGSLEALGLKQIDQVEKDLWNTLQNPQKVSVNLLTRGDVERVQWGENTLLLLRVPKAERSQLPVHLNQSIDKGTYVRVHEGDRLVSTAVARRLLSDSFQDSDSRAIPEYCLDDIDAESVARFRAMLSASRPTHPFLAKEGADFLLAIGAIARDSEKELRPTWAGMWMLGSEISLRQLLPHWHLSFKELPTDPSDTRRWVDRVHPDGMWNANLFEFYLRAVNKITDGLKVPFALDKDQFRIDETEAHKALREALVNALVHADHRGTTGIRIIKGPTGVEFINPGLLLIRTEQFWLGGISEARNPALQRLFGLLQMGEREGSGGPAMKAAWANQQFRAPKVWTDAEYMETHLRLPTESLLTERAVSEAMARFGAQFSELDELGRLIVVTTIVENEVSHSRVRELTDAHSRDVTLKLQELIRKGLLSSRGHQRQKTYLSAKGGSSGVKVDSSGVKVDSSGVKVDSSEPYDASTASRGSSEPYDASSGAKADSLGAKVDSSSALQRFLSAHRSSPLLVQEALLEVCSHEFKSAAQLAEQLRRTPSTVKSRYLPPLVESGRLELLHPESPTHPAQAYRTKKVAPQ